MPAYRWDNLAEGCLARVRRKKRGLPCFVEQTGDTWRPKIGGEEESGWFTELETT